MAKLAVATGTRAEYGIFRPLLREFKARNWDFDLCVTGMHLAPQFGLTVREIEADGFDIAERVDIALGDDAPTAVCKSMSLALVGFAELLQRRQPDLLFILGDRFEALAIATAAKIVGIPIAHLHGGEITEGVIDEAFRHSITKMSHLHFVSAEPYRRRVIQLGESPASVFQVGALGLDNLRTLELLNRQALEAEIGFRFHRCNILVTHHPLTLDLDRSRQDFAALLAALDSLADVGILITAPNADPGGAVIAEMIDAFARRHPERVKLVTSLGTRRYFSALKVVDAVVGNSSSGLIEVPSFGVPTVNIGDRQKGRLEGPSIISAPAETAAITEALTTALSAEFRANIANVPNPYGDGTTATKICDVIAETRFPLPRQKPFFDLELETTPGTSAP